VIAPVEAPTHVVRGPLPVTTNNAVTGMFLQFRPRSPATTGVGDLDLAVTSEYSSLYLSDSSRGDVAVVDAELWRTGVSARTGVGPRTDVEIELPIVYATDGFADDLISGWHSIFGLPDGGRERRPDNEFDVHVDADGQRVYEMQDDEIALGDIPIVVTQRILDEHEDGVALALRAGLELPTGSESDGFGNGGIDWGGGLLAESSAGRITLTGAAYYVVTADPSAFEDAGVDALDSVQVHGGMEVRWNEAASILFGLRYSTAATRDIDLDEIDADVLDLDIGWVHDLLDGSRLTLGFTEDLIARSGPDLTAFLGWSKGF
jgi:hypothetical protein